MKPINGFEPKESTADRIKIPAGAYVAKVVGAKEAQYDWGNRLEVAIDIAEGEFAGYYKKDFDAQPDDFKRWRGVVRMTIPKSGDTSEMATWQKGTIENAINCFMQNNKGFKWNWDETKLKGLTIGVTLRDEEWQLDDGRTGWTARPYKFVNADRVRAGQIKTPAQKPLKNKRPAAELDAPATDTAPAVTETTLNDEDLPF